MRFNYKLYQRCRFTKNQIKYNILHASYHEREMLETAYKQGIAEYVNTALKINANNDNQYRNYLMRIFRNEWDSFV